MGSIKPSVSFWTVWLIVCFFILAQSDLVFSAVKEQARVLLLSSYHPGFPTFFQQIQGVNSVLLENNVLLDVEFMDRKRFANGENEQHFLQLLSYKIRETPPYDVVITADDDALVFMLKHKADLFPVQPVVFFGVNNVATAKAQDGRDDITGVIEAVSMEETIKMAIDLLPVTKKIVALVDATPSSQGDLKTFKQVAQNVPGLAFSELSLANYSFADFARELRKIDNDTAVLLLSAYVDKEENRLLFQQSLELILHNLRQPLFHLWYHGLGQGVLGGKVISHEQQGKTAADIAIRILAGDPVAQMKVIDESPNRNIVDYQVVQKFALENNIYPADTEFLNKPVSLYAQYKLAVWTVGIFLFFQTLLIFFLINVIKMKNRTEAALRDSENRYFSLFAKNHSVMLLVDPETGDIVDANPAACVFYGYPYEKFVGLKAGEVECLSGKNSVSDMATAECVDRNHALLRHRLADGEVRDVEIYSGPLSINSRELRYTIVHDITERKKSEGALRESENNFRTFFASMTDMLFVAKPDGRLLKTNDILCRSLGYSARELSEMRVSNLFALDQRQEAEATVAAMLRQEHGDCHIPLQAKDGNLVPVISLVWRGTWNGKGCIYGTCRNLSAELEAEQRFEHLFRHNPALMALSDAVDGHFVDVNDVWLATTGYCRSEVIGKTPHALKLFPSPEQFKSAGEQLRKDGRITNMELPLRCQDGTLRYGLFSGEKLSRQGGFYYLTVMIDITDRKKAEEVLHTTLKRTQIILSNVQAGILLVSDKQQVEFANQALCNLFDLKQDAAGLIGMSSGEILTKTRQVYADPEKAVAGINRILAQDEPIKNEQIPMRGDRTYLRDYIPINIAGQKYGRLWHHYDITERKQAEEDCRILQSQLIQAQKMEAIGTLAGGIAHDFNNILGALLGYAEMAEEDCPPDSLLAQDIKQILKAGHRAKELVKQILAFSRQSEANKLHVQPAVIITEAIKLLRASLPATISIEQDIDQEAGSILADPTQIHQILMNLATNAFHAMEIKGGTLTISLHKKVLSQDDHEVKKHMQPGNFAQLSIRDTGTGIAPEIREKIFDPYFTTKEVGKGTGMGLAMVHGIVQSYGGSVICDSRLGVGTVFRITLPAVKGASLQEDGVAELTPVGKEHILLVDDEEMLLEMSQSMLERLGYRVTAKANSIAALAVFRQQSEAFDLVITDQTMPGMTGVDLARIMLQICPAMPIILCTGYSSLITEEMARSMGIKGFAMKPLTKKNIAEMIRKVLDV
jgi:PAS domain S-box-containing protein